MADRTARDTVRDVAFERFLEWDDSHTLADAVLAALGIDPDTPVDDVKAGALFLRMCRDSFHNEIVLTVNPDDPQQQDERSWWVAESHAGIAYGLSPAAAVLALAARLEEPGA